MLPKATNKPLVPPIKCQGIKTKLVSFILANIQWNGEGRWVEPFLGSGVVAFNVAPTRALLNDSNPHIINLYQQIYQGDLTPRLVRQYLFQEGRKLLEDGEDYYYFIRDRFNETENLLDFLFLNRSCFNGVMRFNSKGKFNVPFCRKPERFSQAYITKIVNQVAAVRNVMAGKDWVFQSVDWHVILKNLNQDDFVYLDPPYIGRHTDYYNQWDDEEAKDLANMAGELPCGFALSMWKRNKYRANEHIIQHWAWTVERTTEHFYHVGATEDLRNAMTESLLLQPGFEAPFEEERAPVHLRAGYQYHFDL